MSDPPSELLDMLTSDGSPPDDDAGSPSAFDRLLGSLVPGDLPADDFNRALGYAALGSAMILASAAVLSLLPSERAILHSGFYAVGRRTLADVMGVAADAALPIAILGVVLLLATGAVALVGRRDGLTGALYVVQPVVGVVALGGAGVGWATLLMAIAINLLVWVVLIALAVALGLAFVSGLIGATLDG
jgi:hypothetical protein